jgi:hypothetical protein
MLTVLGGLAEFERELIRTRTGEGRERAKARGVVLGRKPKLTGHQRRKAIAQQDIARSYNVSHSTINRLRLHSQEAQVGAFDLLHRRLERSSNVHRDFPHIVPVTAIRKNEAVHLWEEGWISFTVDLARLGRFFIPNV